MELRGTHCSCSRTQVPLGAHCRKTVQSKRRCSPVLERPGAKAHPSGDGEECKEWELSWSDVALTRNEPEGTAEVLGMGRSEPVYRAELVPSKEPVAIKTLSAVNNLPAKHQKKVQERVAAQLDVCHSLQHENIVRYMGACTDPGEGMFIACEAVEGSNLREALNERWPELSFDRRGKHIATCIAKALEYLHTREKPVIHRDIKSSNVLVTRDCSTAKLADVGFAYTDRSGRTKGSATVQWAAPELWLAQQATPLSDVYSFGVVLWEILTLEDARWLQEKVLRNRGLGLPQGTNPYAADLCARCLHVKPHNRPNASQIVRELEQMPLQTAAHAHAEAAACAPVSFQAGPSANSIAVA